MIVTLLLNYQQIISLESMYPGLQTSSDHRIVHYIVGLVLIIWRPIMLMVLYLLKPLIRTIPSIIGIQFLIQVVRLIYPKSLILIVLKMHTGLLLIMIMFNY